jgi:hypothetical protein
MSSRFIALGSLLVFLAASSAQAQVTVDAAKVTCMQFATGKIGRQGSMAYWLSGYLNGKRDNTVIDVPGMEQNVKKLEFYCLKHHETLVMEAAKSVFGLDK